MSSLRLQEVAPALPLIFDTTSALEATCNSVDDDDETYSQHAENLLGNNDVDDNKGT